jgi:lysophospholipase L1-like esterase
VQEPGEPPFPTRDELERLVQLQHPWKVLAGLPGVARLDESVTAGLLGTDPATYGELRADVERAVAESARRLLEDPAVAERVDALPFAPGDVVVALGDSLTADLGSWAEILRRMLDLRRGGDGIRLVNAGVSGETTTDVRKRLVAVAREAPAWVVVLLGINDARRHGHDAPEPLVSREETARNLRLIRDFLGRRTDARLVWMTPPPVLEDLIVRDRRFRFQELIWDDAEVEARAALAHDLGDPVIDLGPVFGRPCPPELLLADGLHPSLVGHERILGAVLKGLSAVAP